MGIDHSNPYIHSTTVLCDTKDGSSPSSLVSNNYLTNEG